MVKNNELALTPERHRRLREALLQCDPFKSQADLNAVFSDPRLTPWQSRLPVADNCDSRVLKTISFLREKYSSDTGKSALVLLLQVLSELIDIGDALHHELSGLAEEIEIHFTVPPTHISSSVAQAQRVKSSEVARSVSHSTQAKAVIGSPQNRKSAMKEKSTVTEKSETITWLHLSDLHFRQSDKFKNRTHLENARVVLGKLLEDIERVIREEKLRPDFIVFTGDVAFSAQEKEYQQSSNADLLHCAADFFDRLLRVTSLDKTRLFIVPGNHDVNWQVLEEQARFVRGCVESLKDRDSVTDFLLSEDEREMAFRKFDHYAKFIHDYFEGALTFSEKDYFYVKTLPLYHQVAILGLNSAWMSACVMDREKPQDRLNLLLGEKQVRDALVKARNAEIRVALMHHPLDWLQDFDRRDVEPLLFKDCDFVLHGHQHSSSISLLHGPDGTTMIIPAGACYHRREYHSGEGEYNGYNFVRLDFSTKQGTIFWRHYDDRGGGRWAADTGLFDRAPQGKYNFALPSLSNILSPQKEREAVTSSVSTPSYTSPKVDTAELRVQLGRQDVVQIESLCLDHFPQVYDKFGRGLRRDEMINLLLDHIRRHSEEAERLSGLLAQDIPKQQVFIPETIRIPAGEFWMGDNKHSNEKPPRMMYLPVYAIGKYPVTNAQYSVFVKETGYRLPEHWQDGAIPVGKENHPIVNIAYQDAIAYCVWLSKINDKRYRLPTEEEWEKAARGLADLSQLAERSQYPWGNETKIGYCNTKESLHNCTTNVDRFASINLSPFGIVDMAGNVWEWTSSWYKPYPGSDYESSRFGEQYRVVRGGSWRNDIEMARISRRGQRKLHEHRDYVGFRVAMDV